MRYRPCAIATLLGLLAGSAVSNASVIPFAVLGPATDASVQIYGLPGTTGSITSPNGFSARFAIGPDAVATAKVCCALSDWSTITNDGFIIRTDRPFAFVGASVYGPRENGDMTALFDYRALGRSYTVLARPDTLIVMTKPPQNGQPPEFTYGPSEFAIVGTRNGTTVTITPKTELYAPGTPGAHGQPAGVPFTITLNAGQVVRYGSVTDATGSTIRASAPVAVFAGTDCSGDKATGCAAENTAIPDNTKFTRMAVVPVSQARDNDKVIVLARKDGTVVKWNGSVVATLAAGQHIEVDAEEGGIVRASKAVLVAKSSNYLSSHSAMTWVPGVDQWTNRYFFSMPADLAIQEQNYIEIAIQTFDIASLLLNGRHVPLDACTALDRGFSTCQIDLGTGAFTLWDRNPFLVLASPGGYELTFTGADFMSEPWWWGHHPFAASAAASVPEPRTLMLMGMGLLLFGALMARLRSTRRQAP